MILINFSLIQYSKTNITVNKNIYFERVLKKMSNKYYIGIRYMVKRRIKLVL